MKLSCLHLLIRPLSIDIYRFSFVVLFVFPETKQFTHSTATKRSGMGLIVVSGSTPKVVKNGKSITRLFYKRYLAGVHRSPISTS